MLNILLFWPLLLVSDDNTRRTNVGFVVLQVAYTAYLLYGAYCLAAIPILALRH